jgi:prepilin-type processing-associated H-X9-DG protein
MTTIKPSSSPGFTRVDLIGLVSAGTLLSLLAVSLLAGTHHQSRTVVCLSNLNQLHRGWSMYSADHLGALPTNPGWCGGSWLQGSSSDPHNWDHETFTRQGLLWPYVQSTDAYVCPEDPSRVIPEGGPDAGRSVGRIRSYSMNSWIGGTGWGGNQGWTVFNNTDQFGSVQSTRLWLLVCERADSINDGFFAVDMRGFPDDPSLARIVDYPSYYHSRGAGFGFVDGHVAVHIWRDARTTPPPTEMLILNVASPGNPDVVWLQERSTRRRD